ncbi:MAG: hypothetical protein P4L85_28100 [Paludisphaera borealis]|uniref:hypothetical protein n=1 Tax=Paludisphaera borealis TaxID=1387353 RepID=UPI002851A390|nr:hypothetical protein [Paludisphaera borealis]MDR3623249.1 hypothetical protein [Paludisphaera borealis]
MTSIRPRSRSGRRFGLRLATGSAWLLLAVSPISVFAQGFGPDPFRPFNSQYDSYVYPIAPGPLDGVGNPSINRGVRGANQFESYLNGIGSANVGTRYDQLYRSQISEHRRAFRPSHDADVKFEDQQASITNLYFDYLRAKDPRKRAAALKKYNQARDQASRDLSSAGRSGSGRKAQKPKRAAAGAEGDKPQATDDEPLDGETADSPDRIITPPRRSAGSAAATTSPRRRSTTPAPPPIPGLSGTGSRGRKPSEILDRAVQSDSAGAQTPSRPRTKPAPPPISP